ncbi:MAG: DNA mismatch repair protein MutS, partial [Rickettsiales bacterium]
MLARDGNFIREGYHSALDEFRILRDESRRLIAGLQSKYQQETGINALKIKHNNVLGYFIEITSAHEKKVLESFIHRQTLANNMRYSTVELSELERKISEAADKSLRLELEIFDTLVADVFDRADTITLAARAIAGIDVALGLAELAVSENYTRPTMDDSTAFAIEGGRHPVVELHLQKEGASAFVGNGCNLEDKHRLWLLTGPNMAGKSTFLRQNALIAILAQMGSFVPADKAHIGVVDKLFSRVGAADDLARGRSTFMVEMVETATILNNATDRSLVILDEIGRGTATYDGLSIAWAVVEYLHNVNRCRALFATHYHELTVLAETLPALSPHTMKVKDWKGEVV